MTRVHHRPQRGDVSSCLINEELMNSTAGILTMTDHSDCQAMLVRESDQYQIFSAHRLRCNLIHYPSCLINYSYCIMLLNAPHGSLYMSWTIDKDDSFQQQKEFIAMSWNDLISVDCCSEREKCSVLLCLCLHHTDAQPALRVSTDEILLYSNECQWSITFVWLISIGLA